MMRKILFLLVLFVMAGPAMAAPTATLTLDQVRGVLIGTWQKADDTAFTREFDANGHCTDRYGNDASATMHGVWDVFTGANAPPEFAPYKPHPTGVYLEMRQNDGMLLYAVSAISLPAVDLTDLQNGKTQRYLRLK